MGIEQRLAEIIRAFHADALSSAVNLNVDLDIALCVLAQALLAALAARLPGYATVTPDWGAPKISDSGPNKVVVRNGGSKCPSVGRSTARSFESRPCGG